MTSLALFKVAGPSASIGALISFENINSSCNYFCAINTIRYSKFTVGILCGREMKGISQIRPCIETRVVDCGCDRIYETVKGVNP